MTQTDGAMPLKNTKREEFAQQYIIDLNATQAATRAGYSSHTAYSQGQRLLKDAEVQRRIAHLQANRAERTQITQDYVLENLQEVLERCMQRAPVMVREGREMVQLQDEQGRDVWEFNAKGALGSLKMLGDHLGMFKTQVEVTGKNGGPVQSVATTVAVTPDDLEGMDAQALARLYFGGKG